MEKQKRTLSHSLNLAQKALRMNIGCMSKLSLVLCIAGFGMALWPNVLSKRYAALTDAIQALYTGSGTLQSAMLLLGALVAAYLLLAGYEYLQGIHQEKDIHVIVRHIKESTMLCAGKVQYRYINNDEGFREKLSFTEMYGAMDVAQSTQQVILVLQHSISVVSIAVLLCTVNAWIVLALLLATVPSILITARHHDEDYKTRTKGMKNSAMSVHLFYMAAGANEQCKSLLDVRFNNFFPWIKDRWRQVSNLYLTEKQAVTKKYLLMNLLADVLRNGVFILVLILTARDIFANPLLGLGTFTLVLTLSQQLQTRLTKLFASSLMFYASINYMEDYFALLDTPVEQQEAVEVAFDVPTVRCENVSFTYPGSNRPALTDVSVTLLPGEKIAIIGENGSGKSTFVNLLCGLFEPTEGNITLDGKAVSKHLQSARKAIAFVPQNFGRYETSIRENITIAQPGRQTDDEELKQIAASIDALPFIASQPGGFDEVIGTYSETGNNLSGGQWQKLALLRALYRKDASLVILDEPTAALDPQAEAGLYRSFRDLTEGKTAVFISHRLGICTTVDRILVFENGRLVEDGTHEVLLRQNGAYTKLYQAQAQWYQ